LNDKLKADCQQTHENMVFMAHGPTAKDYSEFTAESLSTLRAAAEDLRLLLSKTYGMNESLNLVGDHFKLTSRQRQFLYRCVVSPQEAAERRQKIILPSGVRQRELMIDGFNCLIITECCLAGGIVLLADDGLLRDIQGIFGAFRISDNTNEALERITAVLSTTSPAHTTIYLDQRMRYAKSITDKWQNILVAKKVEGEVKIVESADRALRASSGKVIATSDRKSAAEAEKLLDIPRAVADNSPELSYITL